MAILPSAKSIGEQVAIRTGYPSLIQRAIEAFDSTHRLDIAEDATIERNAKLRGEITVGPGATIGHGSDLDGTISIAKDARVGPDSWIDGCVSIGRGTNLTESIEVLAARGDEITIGKHNAIARRTTFQNRFHPTDKPSMQAKFNREIVGESLEEQSKGPIRVGSDVWIGVNAVVLSGVHIGHGAVVGAGAVVTKDVPPYAMVGGVPAERIGWRFDESTRDQLLDIEWWKWSDEKIKRNRSFFQENIENATDVERLIRK